MLKVAFIGDTRFPIPAVCGGAISTLVTGIIDKNEVYHDIDLTVFSANWDGLYKLHERYQYTQFFRIGNPDYLTKMKVFLWRIMRRLTHYHIPYKNSFMIMVNHILANQKFDVIVYENSALEMMQARRYKNTKNVIHIHADYINSEMNGVKDLCRYCDCVVGVSDFITSKMDEIPALKGKGRTLKNAIDLSAFSRHISDNETCELKNKLGFDENDFVVLFCGRLSKEKGCLELIKAVALVPNITLLVVGGENFSSNARTEYIEQLYEEAEKIKGKIVFTGYISHAEVGSYYDLADVAVLPSICNEAAPLTLLEYRAAGLPTVASKMGGIPEYCDDKTTILVEYNDCFVENLAEAIKLLKDDENLRNRMAEAASRDLDQFGYETYYENFVKMMIDICKD